MNLRLVGLSVALNILTLNSLAQTNTGIQNEALVKGTEYYANLIGENSKLYNGVEYIPPRTTTGQPFFKSSNLRPGDLEYDGRRHENVLMLYDLTSDKLIIQQFNSHNLMSIIDEKVRTFSIDGNFFERIIANRNGIHETGFYQILFEGEIRLIAKRKKIIKETVHSGKVNRDVYEKHTYYIFKKGKYINIGSKSSLLNAFVEDKSSIKKILRENGIQYSNNRENALMLVVEHLNSLIK